ncbi:MAG: hypothetical protein J2P31_15030, partial [Blastocatellia bacterium]|nr:hypothetical protein [Blastocatellia bacterium]
MKQRIIALRYLLGLLAVSIALSLVCFAQRAAGSASLPAATHAETAVITNMVNDWTRAKEYT